MLLGYLGDAEESMDLGLDQFFELAANSGFQVEIPRYRPTVASVKKAFEWAYDLCDTADVIILRGCAQTYLQETNVIQKLHNRANKDLSLLAFPNVGSCATPWWNRFLCKYDMLLPEIRLWDKRGKGLEATFCEDYETFRHPALFRGIERVVADDPFAVWYFGDAYPVLVADDEFQPIDWSKDLPRRMNKREMASICVRPSPGGHAVYVFGFDAFSVEENIGLAANLMDCLKGPSAKPLAEQLLKRIEINIFDFVSAVLNTLSDCWWSSLVPEGVREKCEGRQKQEKNPDSPECYLDLIDYRKIISANWPAFQTHFYQVVGNGGKNKLLRWFDRLKHFSSEVHLC